MAKFTFQKINNPDNLTEKTYLVSLADLSIKDIGIVRKYEIANRSKWLGYFTSDDLQNDHARVDASTRQSCADQLFTLFRSDHIEWVDGVKYIDLSVSSPDKIHICFESTLNKDERIRAALAVDYWLGAGCITANGTDSSLVWGTNNQQLYVTAEFESGYFEGDLTHHDAIFSGDTEFTIGLIKLLHKGHETRNRTVKPVGVNVRNIRFYYEELEIPEVNDLITHQHIAELERKIDELDSKYDSLRQSIMRLEAVESKFRNSMSLFLQ